LGKLQGWTARSASACGARRRKGRRKGTGRLLGAGAGRAGAPVPPTDGFGDGVERIGVGVVTAFAARLLGLVFVAGAGLGMMRPPPMGGRGSRLESGQDKGTREDEK